MPLHVSSELITGDGTESAKIKGTVVSTELVSASDEFPQSTHGGNIMWQGPPPNVGMIVDVMWMGANNLGVVAAGDTVQFYDGFGGGPPGGNYVTGTADEVQESTSSDLNMRLDVTAVNNFNPNGPPMWGMVLSSSNTRLTLNYDFGSSNNSWENLNISEPNAGENIVTIFDQNYTVSAHDGVTIDIPGNMGDDTPDAGTIVTKPFGVHAEKNVNKEQIKLDPILGMNVTRTDGSTRYVPIFEYARGRSDWDDDYLGETFYNAENFILGGMIRFAPGTWDNYGLNTSNGSYRSVHIGGGPLVNGNHLGRIPTTKRNISLGFNIMSDVQEWTEETSSKDAHTNIFMGWDIGECPSFSPKSSIIMGQDVCRQWSGGGNGTTTYNFIAGWGIGSDTENGSNTNQNINNTSNVLIGREVCRNAGANIDNNICLGLEANYSMGDSSYGNVAIGKNAGHHHTWSFGQQRIGFSNNIDIGDGSRPSAWGASNEATIGNSYITTLRCNQTSISSLSDRRDKTSIEDLPDGAGLAFIKSLSPKIFYWDRREWYNEERQYEEGDDFKPDWRKVGDTYIVPQDRTGEKIEETFDWDKPNSGLRMGFIAQDLQEAISSTNSTTKKALEDCKLVYDRNPDVLEARPQELIVPMVKAIQELCARIEALENE